MPHEDGAAYHPVVATVSLGGSLVLDVTEKGSHEVSNDSNDQRPAKKSWRIFQEPRSLLVTTGSAYADTLHGIAEVKEDIELNESTVANWDLLGNQDVLVANGGENERTTRISLTYRDVLKVSNVGSKIFGKQRT
jgi:alkylated DNA repair protein alkB family protein 6